MPNLGFDRDGNPLRDAGHRDDTTDSSTHQAAESHRARSSSARQRDPDVMDADDVAAFLGVDRKTVYDHAGRGTLPCRRLGRRLLFSRQALVVWLAGCKVASRTNGA